MIVTIILLSIFCGFLIVFSVIQLKTRLKHQNALLNIYYKIEQTLNIMRNIDRIGAFQSDDEVGKTFFLLTEAINQLRNYIAGEMSNKNERTKK